MRNSKIVRLREKKLQNGFNSLYLDIYQDGKRKYIFLKIYVKINPQSQSDRRERKELLSLAENIRSQKELEIKHSEFGFISPRMKKINLFHYIENKIDVNRNRDKQ